MAGCLWMGAPALAAPNAAMAVINPQPTPPPAPLVQHDYVVQNGDDLQILAFNNAELGQKVKVRPDGKISLLLLNDVKAAGLTAEDLSAILSRDYAKFFRNPRITVSVTSFSNQEVFVGGEVQTPKLLPLNGRLTLAAAIFSAGGLKISAKSKSIYLLRDSEGKPAVMQVDLKKIFESKQPDIELKPFDVVFVPKSKIGKVDQFVEQYVRQVLPVTVGMGFSYLLGQQPLIQ
ncbi:MAG TPA: polysaccharide biosynthesis/export family protein [Bryobacteraceae bacterium]|nr:polysaccharide biosynthesis/export family protein [Bryobacteraceae bacterium]